MTPDPMTNPAQISPPQPAPEGPGRIAALAAKAATYFLKLVHVIFRTLAWLFVRIPGIKQTAKYIGHHTAPLRLNLSRHISAWRIAWAEARREEPLKVPAGRELEFLPAVLEIQESPPSPLGRAVAITIILVFAVAVLWAMVGKIDIVAVAQGKVVPGGRSKLIQPLESGVVKAIYVQDGSRVKAGDPLIEIDTTAGADREKYINEHFSALLEIARLRALLADQETFDAPKGAEPSLVQAARAHLRDQLTEYRALKAQAEAYKSLLEKQFVPRLQYLEFERKRAEKINEYTTSLASAETRVRSLSKEITKAGTRADQQHLAAPISGVVQQLAVHTVGGVVTPAQQLMVIAPEEGSLEVEAILENKDIGFVNENQEAEIKVDAFPFTRYGTIEGRVVNLSRDAVQIDKVGLVYTARVNLSRPDIQIENRAVRLSPGMTVSVEIKTGERRVIEYFLSPLIQATQNSIRER